MKSGLLLRLGALAGAASLAAAECPNACSGHGTCGNYDMCTCYTGYMGNDCSERVCPFGLAHVDSPKGDLDMDNDVEYATVVEESQMYKDGTSELFPIMKSTNGTDIEETGHYYMECSNKGLCDRTTATCECFAGYEGASCHRASCPNDCSGHGVCKSNRELAADDHGNLYELWDADIGMACDCDPGYGGYDCSQRFCPYGIDPLFIDDENTARMPEWTLYFGHGDSGELSAATGTWRLRFFDVFGEDWITKPIDFNVDCTAIETELESIPNDVVSMVSCTKTGDATSPTPTPNLQPRTFYEFFITGSSASTEEYIKYELKFEGNPGGHQVPEIVVHDATGSVTLTDGTGSALDNVAVYDTGVTGEFFDFFGQKCGVTVTIQDPDDFYENSPRYDMDPAEAANEIHYGEVQRATVASGDLSTLKKCLGDSNAQSADNVDVENWDYGGPTGEYGVDDLGNQAGGTGNEVKHAVPGQFPHMVKLVDTEASSEYDGGVYTIMVWHTEDENFVLSAAVDNSKTYEVFATDGVLERVWYDSDLSGTFDLKKEDTSATNYEPETGWDDKSFDELGLAYWNVFSDTIYTQHDFSCENAGTKKIDPVFTDGTSSFLNNNCLEKGDLLVIPSFTTPVTNKDSLGLDHQIADTPTATYAQDYGLSQAEALNTLNSAGIYEIMKISVQDYTKDSNKTEDRFQITLDRPIFWDGSHTMIHEEGSAYEDAGSGIRQFYRFIPDMGSSYTSQWVAPCSNRGVCDTSAGLCNCFAGYTNENCDTQSALAV